MSIAGLKGRVRKIEEAAQRAADAADCIRIVFVQAGTSTDNADSIVVDFSDGQVTADAEGNRLRV